MESQPSYINDQNTSFSYREKHAHKHDIILRIIWTASSFLISMLALRFVLALLGANPANGFDSFVNNFTAPFAAPFYSLFSYDHPSVGISVFEGYTLIAMAVYALVTEGLARIVSVTKY
jgi:hypothetical protein